MTRDTILKADPDDKLHQHVHVIFSKWGVITLWMLVSSSKGVGLVFRTMHYPRHEYTQTYWTGVRAIESLTRGRIMNMAQRFGRRIWHCHMERVNRYYGGTQTWADSIDKAEHNAAKELAYLEGRCESTRQRRQEKRDGFLEQDPVARAEEELEAL